jgi:hypothetical protein
MDMYKLQLRVGCITRSLQDLDVAQSLNRDRLLSL